MAILVFTSDNIYYVNLEEKGGGRQPDFHSVAAHPAPAGRKNHTLPIFPL